MNLENQGIIESVAACAEICQSLWETCKAYEFDNSYKACYTITDSVKMLGDTEPNYQCFTINEVTALNSEMRDGFVSQKGKCSSSNGSVPTDVKEE